MVGLADRLELPLNLGGGVQLGDGLEGFKRGFANAELSFPTHEIVCDRGAYDRLCEGRAGKTSSPPTGRRRSLGAGAARCPPSGRPGGAR